jgi:hypothetical protein
LSHHKLVGKPKTITLTRGMLRRVREVQSHVHVLGVVEPVEIPYIPNLETKILRAVEDKKDLKKLDLKPGKIRGTLDMSSWHGDEERECGTTHCRAGWAVFFGGKAGKKLSRRFGPGGAGALIYFISTGYIPSFSADEDENWVLEDIAEKAAMEQRRRKPFNFKKYLKEQDA